MRGMGGYVENAIVTTGMPGAHNPVPDFKANPDGSITLSNKEYVTDIFAPGYATSSTTAVGNATFTNTVYPINPGIEKTFPWLCQIAENYDEYTLKQCIFTYKSSVADFASASGQVGQILMATQYNASQAPFQDKQTMMQYAFACSGKTSEDMLQGVECDPAKLSGPRGHFVRNGPIPAGYTGDLNNYDHGQLNIAVADCPVTYAGQQLGELWISYTVELRKPKFVTANGWGISRDVFLSKAQSFGAVPFGSSAPAYSATLFSGQQNSIGAQLLRPGSSLATVPASQAAAQQAGVDYYLPTQNNQVVLSANAIASTDILSFGIKFPSSYSGNVRITFSVGCIATQSLPTYKIYASGGSNIRAINDLFNSASDTWQAALGHNSPVIDAPRLITCDIRIDPPTSGFGNYLLFCVNTGQGQSETVSNAMIDIQEYNTLFNYKQDGSNDRICTVNSSGVVELF